MYTNISAKYINILRINEQKMTQGLPWVIFQKLGILLRPCLFCFSPKFQFLLDFFNALIR